MLIIDNKLKMTTTRFIKPKIDKYIQLYSRVEDGTFTGKIGNIIVTNGGQWYDDEKEAFPPIVTISPPDIATSNSNSRSR